MKLFTNIDTENPIKYLFSWKAQERSWKEKDRSWYVVYSFFFTVLILFLALIGEWVLIIAVLGFAFLWFIQASVEPPIVEHVISTVGIKSFNKLHKWSDIKLFWFSKKGDVTVLNLDMVNPDKPDSLFSTRLSLIINAQDTEEIFTLLYKYLDYGDATEVGVNFLTDIVYGKHIDIENFMEKPMEEELDRIIAEHTQNTP